MNANRESGIPSPVCVVPAGDSFEGRQGLTYLKGLTGASTGARGICMTVVTLPPGARAKAHLHRGIETAVYVIEGRAEIRFGDRLERRLESRSGEYRYIAPDTPHVVMNLWDAVCRAVVAHTAPDDQEGIELLPALDVPLLPV